MPIHLGINERDEAVIVSKVEYPMLGSRVGSWIGKRMELHCTGLGKALISEWSEDELTRLVRHRTLSRHNDNTICTLAKLQRDLAQARLNGYAIDDEEDVLGFRCVGVPVHDETGAVVAALSASGTVSEITADNVRTIGLALGTASRELSLALLPQPAGLADLSDVRQVC
jgi:DNA-binding IclR family transcriptional regulator